MRFSDVRIPLRLTWSSPFARWQSDLADFDSLDFAVQTTSTALERGGQDPAELSSLVLGITVPQHRSFYGGPTVAARLGAPHATGPMVSQACATSVAALVQGALTVQAEADATVAVITTDRTSNAPTLVYPSSRRPGNTAVTEAWVLDNFSFDPWAQASMIAAAENVAKAHGITRHQLDEVTLLRYEQYQKGLTGARPWEVPIDLGRSKVLAGDVGVFPTTAEGLAKLHPVEPGGVITDGTQTHPADGTAGVVATSRPAEGTGPVARLLSAAFARVDKSRMPEAPVPAARKALQDAGIGIDGVHVVTTHSPFAVNDVYFNQEMGFPLDAMNPYGCSLIYGHPQAPTGMRAITELLWALERRGGGIGLFTGCAAGD
ncbi:MAG: thiolase family protein, partial [Acidimicrobiales bacterium]